MFHKICVLGIIIFILNFVGVAMATVCTSLDYGEACQEFYGMDLTGWESQPQSAQSVCGTDAFYGANGFQYRYSDEAYDDGCFCNIQNDPNMFFYWGVGCYCNEGYYNESSSSTKCQKCPSDYPLSMAVSIKNGSASVMNVGAMEDVCYRKYKQKAQNVTLGLQISMIEEEYGDDPYITDVKCDAGYWQSYSFGEFYYYGNVYRCDPVGTAYYSTTDNMRASCPMYVTASGDRIAGQTVGYGSEADDITDCMIPESQQFSDATGKYVYPGGCKYSK